LIYCVVKNPHDFWGYIFARVKCETVGAFDVIHLPVRGRGAGFIAKRHIKKAQKLCGESYVIFEAQPLFPCNVYPYRPKRAFYENIDKIISAYKYDELAIICKNIGDERLRDIIGRVGGFFAVTWIFYKEGDRAGFYGHKYDCQVFVSSDGNNIKNADAVIALDNLPVVSKAKKTAIILNLSDGVIEGENVMNEYNPRSGQKKIEIPRIPQEILDDALYNAQFAMRNS